MSGQSWQISKPDSWADAITDNVLKTHVAMAVLNSAIKSRDQEIGL